MAEDLKIVIPAADLPAPGEDVLFVIEGGYEALVANTGAPETDLDETEPTEPGEPEPSFFYEVVNVRGATRTHAAVVRRRGTRTVVNRWTLCSVSNSRRVIGRRRDQELNTVTCTQCARRLEDAGEL